VGWPAGFTTDTTNPSATNDGLAKITASNNNRCVGQKIINGHFFFFENFPFSSLTSSDSDSSLLTPLLPKKLNLNTSATKFQIELESEDIFGVQTRVSATIAAINVAEALRNRTPAPPPLITLVGS
jgi:hypothetical protein